MSDLAWNKTPGGAYEAGPYYVAERVDGKGWNACMTDGHQIVLAVDLESAKTAAEVHAKNTTDIEWLVLNIDARVAACHPKVVTEHTASRLACFVRDNWATIRAALSHQQRKDDSNG